MNISFKSKESVCEIDGIQPFTNFSILILFFPMFLFIPLKYFKGDQKGTLGRKELIKVNIKNVTLRRTRKMDFISNWTFLFSDILGLKFITTSKLKVRKTLEECSEPWQTRHFTNYFRKKVHLWMFNRVLNTLLKVKAWWWA